MSSNIEDQVEASTSTQPLDDSNELLERRMQGNRSLFNILLMSVGFLLIFTAFNSSSLIQETIVRSINTQDGVRWNGFAALSIVYGVFSFSNFLVPSILSMVSSARCLFFAGLTYLAYTMIFLYPIKYELEIVSAIVGFGAAVMWTAQGNYLTENSDSQTIDRNTGIFWAIFQGSLVFGNMFLYFQFRGQGDVPYQVRFNFYLVLSIICAIGCFLLLLLKKTTTRAITTDLASLDQTNPIVALKKCFKLVKTKKMLLLSISCFYTGLELSFYSSVFSTAISNTQAFGSDAIKLIGVYGCFVGSGSILGGLLFGLAGKRFVQNNRSRVFLLGFAIHVIAFFLIYLNHPNASTQNVTPAEAYIHSPKKWISMLCGFLLGFGDACFNTQIISLIGTIYTEDSNYTSSAFALYKFTQSIGASISFFYSSKHILLSIHLIILVIFSVLGSASFVMVEIFVKREND